MTIYYVSSLTGNDANSGTVSGAAFATIQAAADHTNPGDTVEVMNGTYKNLGYGGYVAEITRSGTAGAPITFEAAPGQAPVIDTTNQWVGLQVSGASYITIKGFEITGNAASVSSAYAQSQAGNTNNPTTSDTGIEVDPAGSTHSTHLILENNTIHDQGGAGIQVAGADYVTVANNKVFNNAWWSPFANSGISIFKAYNSDANTGYKTVITGNTVYGNQEFVPWKAVGQITDGNGIIIDSNNQTGYTGRTLVENNLTYANGGTGAHAIDSNHVDFFYNTAYGNNVTPALNEGQIVGQNSNDVRIENNVMVSTGGDMVNYALNGYSVTYDYNVYAGGSGPQVVGAHDIVADPKLASPGGGNFQLLAGSPAIGSATNQFANPTDILGNPRGASPDRGAFQSGTATPPPPPPPPPVPTANDTLVLVVSADVWLGPPQFTVSVDGKQVGGTFTTSALHDAGQTSTVTLSGKFGLGVHDVAVSFLNDAWGGTHQTDRNLYVQGVSLDGTPTTSPAAALYRTGTAHFSVAHATS